MEYDAALSRWCANRAGGPPELPFVFEGSVLRVFRWSHLASIAPPADLEEREAVSIEILRIGSLSHLVDTGPTALGAGWARRFLIGGSGEEMIRQALPPALHRRLEWVRPVQALALRAPCEATARYSRQHSEPGLWAEIRLRVEPAGGPPDLVVDARATRSLDEMAIYRNAIFHGVRYAASVGLEPGRPVRGVRVTVTGGRVHPVDSCERAFVLAAAEAFLAAIRPMA